MMENKKKLFLGSGIATIVLACIIAAFLIISNSNPVVIQPVEQKKYVLVPLGAQPGTNETGFNYSYIVPHQADPATAYASNWSGTIYESSTEFDEEMTGTTPFNTPVDILYKVQINYSDGYDVTEAEWNMSYCYFLLTCADLGIGADTNLTEIQIANCSSDMWVHYYANNNGNGYTLSHNQKINNTAEKLYVFR